MSLWRTISCSVAALGLIHAEGELRSEPIAVDTLIMGGEVFDGTGAPPQIMDVAIAGGRIVYVGPDGGTAVAAHRTIDATGMFVIPGFIDPHTHADGELSSDDPHERANSSYLRQGVTTVVVGNDGGGDANIGQTAAGFDAAGIGTNVGIMVGFGAVRSEVMGESDRAPHADELKLMQAQVAQAVCEGALGFSTGLHYAPQSFASIDEIIILAKEAGRRGALYDSHLRDESSYSVGLEASVAEALEIGRRSGAAVHIAHIKALGPDVWGKSEAVIGLIEDARAKGQAVTADQYPWRASGTRISNALVPRWALDGGMPGLRARLADPATASRLLTEMRENLRRRGGASNLLLTRGFGGASKWDGMTLAEVAEASATDPVEAAIDILRTADARVASFNMSQSDIDAFALQPWVMTGSDGSTGHPRKYATYPKAYRDLVQTGKMDMATFVRRSSGLVADAFGLHDRGYIEKGRAADLAIIAPGEFAPKADYAEPETLSVGVHYLFVNGALAIDDARVTGELKGRALLRSVPAGECS